MVEEEEAQRMLLELEVPVLLGEEMEVTPPLGLTPLLILEAVAEVVLTQLE